MSRYKGGDSLEQDSSEHQEEEHQEEDLLAVRRKLASRRVLYVILGGLLLGGGSAAVTYFLFPAAITTIAALLSLTGPLVLVVPLVSVGVIGAFFGMELLAFLEEGLLSTDRLNHNFMRNLVIFSALVAGIALGVFIVASTPAVFALVSFAANVPVVGVALPYVMGGTATLLVTGLIGYALYRVSGMQREQWHRDIQQVVKSYSARQAEEEPIFITNDPLKERLVKKCLDLLELGIKRGYSKEDLTRALAEMNAMYKGKEEEENIFAPLAQAILGDQRSTEVLKILNGLRAKPALVKGDDMPALEQRFGEAEEGQFDSDEPITPSYSVVKDKTESTSSLVPGKGNQAVAASKKETPDQGRPSFWRGPIAWWNWKPGVDGSAQSPVSGAAYEAGQDEGNNIGDGGGPSQ